MQGERSKGHRQTVIHEEIQCAIALRPESVCRSVGELYEFLKRQTWKVSLK